MASQPALMHAVRPALIASTVALAWVEAAALTYTFIALGAAIDALMNAQVDGGGSGQGTAHLAALAGSAAVAAAAAAGSALLAARAQHDAERTLRAGLLTSIWRGGVTAATGNTGALLSLLTDSVPRAARYRGAFLGPTVGAFTTPFVAIALVAWLVDLPTAAVLGVMILVVPALIVLAQRAARRPGAAHRREQGRLTALFRQNVQGLGTLVTHRAAASAMHELQQQGERHRRSLMRVLAVNQIIVLVMDATVNLGLLLVGALLALHRFAEGAITLGASLTIVLATLVVIRPIGLVGQFFYIGIGGRAAERAISAQLTDATAPTRATRRADRGDADPHPVPPALALDGVTARWVLGGGGSAAPSGVPPVIAPPVIKDFSLHVAPGEHVALVGPSGAGKSTIAALLQAHLLPVSGRVSVRGDATDEVAASVIRERIATVEQRTFLFHGTIADNLEIADPGVSEQGMWDALAVAGLEREVRAMPQGLATPVGEHGLALSGGQSQRLAIARAAIRNAPILILDEPTSQVDLVGEAAFLERLHDLARGRTVLMIAHRPGTLIAADRTVTLEGAK